MNPLLPNRPKPFNELTIASAKGSIIYNERNRQIIDFTSGFGVAALGYSHPKIVESVSRQLRSLSHAIPSVVGFVGDDLAARAILECVGREDFGVVITTSGSEAIEVALKAAFLRTGCAGVVVVDGGYHGQSLGTLSVNAQTGFADPFNPLLSRRARVMKYSRPSVDIDTLTDQDITVLGELAGWIDELADSLSAIGAVLIEPMQNLAGYRPFTRAFAGRLSALCRAKGICLIADEVFTGFGRCGEWCLSEKCGFIPDLAVYGKALTGGIPGGACVGPREFLGPLFPRGGVPLHAPTFYNAPVVCAAMLASIQVIRDNELLSMSAEIGRKIAVALSSIIGNKSESCEVRGYGAAQALVFNDDAGDLESGRVRATNLCGLLLNTGVLALNSGFPKGNAVTFCPPLVISDGELNTALERICAAAEQVI